MIMVSLSCSHCGVDSPLGKRKNSKIAIYSLRKAAQDLGWVSEPHSTRDFCPKCAALLKIKKDK